MTINKKTVTFGAFLLATSAGWAAVETSVNVKAVYDDNIYRQQTNEVDAWITRVKPGLKIVAGQGGHEFKFDANAESGIYSQSQAGDDDYTDYQLGASGKLEFNKRNRLEISGRTQYGHDDRGTGRMDVANKVMGSATTPPDSREPDTWQKSNVGTKYSFGVPDGWGVIDLSLGYEKTDYKNNEPSTTALEYDQFSTTLKGTFSLSASMKLLLEASDKSFRYDHANRDSDENRYTAGLQWKAASLSGSASYGYQTRRPDGAATFKDYSDNAWQADVMWKPRSYSSLRLKSFKGVEDGKSSPSLIDVETHTLRWRHEWNKRLSSSVFYELRTEDYDAITRDEDIYKWGFSGDYRWQDWLVLSGGYQYEDREVSVPGGGLDYERNVVTFGAELMFK